VVDILAGLSVAEPGWRLSLIVPDEGPLATRARAFGVHVVVVRMSSAVAKLGDAMTSGAQLLRVAFQALRAVPRILEYGLRLRHALKACEPDLVHAHGFKMQILTMWMRPPRARVVLHLHDYLGERPLVSRVLRLVLRRPVVALAISESVAADATRAFGDRLPVTVIYNGIDPDHWSPVGPLADLDALSGLDLAPRGTIRVGLVATLARWKGHETFLRALALLPADLPIRAYIVGGAIYRTDGSQADLGELRRMVGTLAVPAPVGFTGYVSEPANAMRALDIVVHASTRPEPFGRVIVEGMALERAVVVSSAGGAAELILPGENALAYHPGDAVALANCIRILAQDAGLRRALGERARLHAIARFSRNAMIESLVALYRDTAG
jgi:glycosyltransferase involved in cell wall biosynthesis